MRNITRTVVSSVFFNKTTSTDTESSLDDKRTKQKILELIPIQTTGETAFPSTPAFKDYYTMSDTEPTEMIRS